MAGNTDVSARIVFSTFGSLGDLHPMMAIALELRARGHEPAIATCELYRTKVEAAGLGFYAIRPDMPPPRESQELVRRMWHPTRGIEFVFRQWFGPALRDSYHDLQNAARTADLLVSYSNTLAVPLIAEKLKKKWVSTVVAPLALWSAHDLSYAPGVVMHPASHKLSPAFLRAGYRITTHFTRRWVREVDVFRKELGLPRGAHPMLEGQHSPYGVLALFSRALAAPQPDWPQPTTICGYCFYDRKGLVPGTSIEGADEELAPKLRAFLDAGENPIVFTLGSAAVFDAGNFFEQSTQAARLLGRRALLFIGDETNRPASLPQNTADLAAFDYAPYSAVFSRACAVVHQGGSGTTGQALSAGVPSLIMPYAQDQPDHAMRVQRLGAGRYIARNRYQAKRAARELDAILNDESYTRRAREIAIQVRSENGPRTAADAIEAVLNS